MSSTNDPNDMSGFSLHCPECGAPVTMKPGEQKVTCHFCYEEITKPIKRRLPPEVIEMRAEKASKAKVSGTKPTTSIPEKPTPSLIAPKPTPIESKPIPSVKTDVKPTHLATKTDSEKKSKPELKQSIPEAKKIEKSEPEVQVKPTIAEKVKNQSKKSTKKSAKSKKSSKSKK